MIFDVFLIWYLVALWVSSFVGVGATQKFAVLGISCFNYFVLGLVCVYGILRYFVCFR